MLKRHLYVPNCFKDLLRHGRGTKYMNHLTFLLYFIFNNWRWVFLTDGFSTLLIFVNFLYSSHTYQLRTQGYVILLMRYASYNSSFKLNLVLDMQFGLAKVRIRVSVRLLLHRLLLLLWQQIHLSTRISCQLSNLGHLHYILPCLLSQL